VPHRDWFGSDYGCVIDGSHELHPLLGFRFRRVALEQSSFQLEKNMLTKFDGNMHSRNGRQACVPLQRKQSMLSLINQMLIPWISRNETKQLMDPSAKPWHSRTRKKITQPHRVQTSGG
jgi:hypothetical protein